MGWGGVGWGVGIEVGVGGGLPLAAPMCPLPAAMCSAVLPCASCAFTFCSPQPRERARMVRWTDSGRAPKPGTEALLARFVRNSAISYLSSFDECLQILQFAVASTQQHLLLARHPNEQVSAERPRERGDRQSDNGECDDGRDDGDGDGERERELKGSDRV